MKTNEFSFALRMVIFFKDYVFPSPTHKPEAFKLVSESYQYMIQDKANFFGVPFLFKYGLNSIAVATSLAQPAAIFSALGAALVFRTYFQGKRIIINSKITKYARLDTSSKIFKALLKYDWVDITTGMRTKIFSINKAHKSIERNFGIISQNIIPLSFELLCSLLIILYMYGPVYSMIYIGMIGIFFPQLKN